MPSKPGSVKVAFDFDPEIKQKLSQLKLDLRYEKGLAATETGILETLIDATSLDVLARLYRKRLGT